MRRKFKRLTAFLLSAAMVFPFFGEYPSGTFDFDWGFDWSVSAAEALTDNTTGVTLSDAAASVTIGGNITYHLTLGDAITAVENCAAEDAAVVKLLDNVDLGNNRLEITSGVFTIDLGGKTVTGEDDDTFWINGSGANVTFKNGSIKAVKSCVYVATGTANILNVSMSVTEKAGVAAFINSGSNPYSPGKLYIDGATITSAGRGVASSYNGASVEIKNSSISGEMADIGKNNATLWLGENVTFPGGLTCRYDTLNDYLAEGYAYWQDGKMLTVADDATSIDGDVTVKAECKHEGCTLSDYKPTDDGEKHTAICSCCGTEVTEEHDVTCTADGNTITVSCSANCGYTGSATISASSKNCDGTAVTATVAKTGIFENEDVIVNYYQGDTSIGDEAPINAGTYTAKITYEGVTASVEFTINHVDADNNGYCDGCGAIYDGIGAHLAGYSVSLNGSIGVNFHMDLTQDVLDDNEAYMLFTLPNGITQKVMVSDARANGPADIEGKKYYIFTCNVAAKEMTDTIQAQLITSDGSKTQVYEYSVREYADTILSDMSSSYDDETKELVKAMLHYGAYSQEWFDYNTTNLANAELENFGLSEADNWDLFDPSISNNDKVGSFTSAYLTLESDTAINLKFKLADGVSFEDLRVVVQDPMLNVVPATIVTTGNVCLITLKGIKASDLDTTYDFSVTDKEGNKSAILYSAMSYACAVAKSEMDQKLKDLTAALRIFNIRANEKFED